MAAVSTPPRPGGGAASAAAVGGDSAHKGKREKGSASDTGVWATLLAESTTEKKVVDGTLLVVGDTGSGKATLVDQLLMEAGVDPVEAGVGALPAPAAAVVAGNVVSRSGPMRYTYAPMAGDDIDADAGDEANNDGSIGIWVVGDGDATPSLLPLAIAEDTLDHAVVMIVLDGSRPWDAKRSLSKWLERISACIADVEAVDRGATHGSDSGKDSAADGAETAAERRRRRLQRFLQLYREPKRGEGSDDESEDSKGSDDGDEVEAEASEVDDVVDDIPMREGTLAAANLGVALVVVVAKSEMLYRKGAPSTLTDQQQAYLQGHLRSTCLSYGAALVFASREDPRQGALLWRYVLHRTLPKAFRFRHRPVSDKGAIFVPAGYDSAAMIADVYIENDASHGADVPFDKVIPAVEEPVEKDGEADKTPVAEDDAGFIEHVKRYVDKQGNSGEKRRKGLGRAVSSTSRGNDAQTEAFFKDLLDQPAKAAGGSRRTKSRGEGASRTATRRSTRLRKGAKKTGE